MDPAEERFLKYVDKIGPVPDQRLAHYKGLDHCWQWVGQVTRDGYGAFKYEGSKRRAHRVAYQLFVGCIPDGHHVLHRCDHPRCVNPAHLMVGLPKDNTLDMLRKGRKAILSGDTNPLHKNPELACRGDAHWTRKHPANVARGETNHQAQLTAANVRYIRDNHKFRVVTYKYFAALFGVSTGTIGDAVCRRTWKHLP